MNLRIFIERPVLSTVISIILVMLGFLGYFSLPVTQYPDIAPPSVEVSASYPGANAQTVLESVVIPLEEQINGVEGMTYITSTSSNDGQASITIYFKQGYDPDIAAVNVQNRVSRAASLLPEIVNRTGVVTQKLEASPIMYAGIISKNPSFDATFIQNYIEIFIKPEILRIDGVGKFSAFGAKEYSMRVWVSPTKMANYGVNISDITTAINEQSMEVSAGALGQNSGQAFEYTIRYSGRYKEVEQYENIVIKALENGDILKLGDLADISLGAFSYTGAGYAGNYPATSFGIFQTPNSNAQEISQNIKDAFKKLQAEMPEGLEIVINFDTNRFLEASFNKVKRTIFEAFILVFIVILIFLHSPRSTIIPAIAVPVSIIGTFFFLDLAGFSLNLLTLFALILAVGIVIDDAIVVVEAIHSKLEKGEKDPKKASISAMSEIGAAIVSITLVMAAVFVPVTFISGPSGVFYKQFGITLIIAILISAVNALTLSPALCALFLRTKEEKKPKNIFQKFGVQFDKGFNYVLGRYGKTLSYLFKKQWIVIIILLIFASIIYLGNEKLSKGFVPNEDQGVIFANIELPAGASLERTIEVNQHLYEMAKNIPGINSYVNYNGANFFNGAGSQYALGFFTLKPWNERKDESKSLEGIIGALYGVSSQIPDAQMIFFGPPSIRGYGAANGVEAHIIDKTARSLKALDSISRSYSSQLLSSPVIQQVSNSFNTNIPQYELTLDVPRMKTAGVSVNQLLGNLQAFIGGMYVADFSKFGKQYRVNLQAKPEYRKDLSSLDLMFVRNQYGDDAPIREFINLKRVFGPQSINRFNLYNAVTLNGAANKGYSSGDAIEAFRKLENTLPTDYDLTFSGLSREEIMAQGKVVTIFILSLLFVFFLLAAQYESYLLPLAVIFSLIIGVGGAYATVLVTGLENNIFFQIALVMLIGLLAKNAILIVEISRQKRQQGHSLHEAALLGAKTRLRPILMTSLAFIIGLLPLVLAQGVNSVGNRSIGTGAVGGMLIGTLIGVLVIPNLFVAFQYLHEKFAKLINR